ncbi:GerMN domain-containing protein [Hydrogenibacillus schlegelii]|uniref:GerMN domain-containing protein n=1 Tax=Hydrogenibacillus schlegelii TaxID=1484 RepID=A0A132MHG9_HYDSH|nr:GerMN domain-containing protein [Hydrogenibacillus schlegelii]KWW97284.1 hypothetical protein TR75_09410 [Hydrogenibacillus schlegelii]OAR05572.1 hypothetical protein SA87_11915 [Hydrogenibacillus schlegelii]
MRKCTVGGRWIRGTLFVVLIFGLGIGGCAWGAQPSSAPIDPPPLPKADVPEEGPDGGAGARPTEMPSGWVNATLYAIDAHGYVMPLTVRLPHAEGVARQVLLHMVDGGPGTALLPAGFRLPLPKGTQMSVDVRPDGTAVVDWTGAFDRYRPEDEVRIVQAVTWALTEFPTVRKVRFLLRGESLQAMPVAGLPLPEALDRSIGLNVEFSPAARPGETTAVTVFFEGESVDGTFRYFVPVTRLVPRTLDPAAAALEELIRGPAPGSPLLPTVVPGAEVHRISADGEAAVVDVASELLGPEPKRTGLRAVEAAALSLLTSLPLKKVHFLVDGRPIQLGDALDLTQPVTRPKSINPLAF